MDCHTTWYRTGKSLTDWETAQPTRLYSEHPALSSHCTRSVCRLTDSDEVATGDVSPAKPTSKVSVRQQLTHVLVCSHMTLMDQQDTRALQCHVCDSQEVTQLTDGGSPTRGSLSSLTPVCCVDQSQVTLLQGYRKLFWSCLG